MIRVLLFFLLTCSLSVLAEGPAEVRFLAYNLENYIRSVPEGSRPVEPKSEKSIAALIAVIASEKPDIIGVCEMGAPAEFEDFLTRLKAAGLDFPHTEYVQAADLERHVALASRFPISARHSQTNLSFDLIGKKQYYKRGILDVTIDVTATCQLHFIGTHLKSKRDVPEDESLVRRGEAHLLRLHCKSILEKTPDARMLVYGDFNDTINEASIREIMGRKNSDDALRPVDLRDVNGDKWTHYWKTADIYSRIDYVLTSRAATQDVIAEKSHIPRPANWYEASDHRPLVVVLRVRP
ncbi:MAG: endonuclease/exonuclease/phosphatase family protein [Chthoniobacterales bacterium]